MKRRTRSHTLTFSSMLAALVAAGVPAVAAPVAAAAAAVQVAEGQNPCAPTEGDKRPANPCRPGNPCAPRRKRKKAQTEGDG
jgi:hypothetical protein